MDLLVYDGEKQAGPYAVETVAEMIRSGAISQEAHVWHEGATDWIPVATYLAQRSPPIAAPAAGPSRIAAAVSTRRTESVPTEGATFGKAAVAGIAVAVLGGAMWAAFQIGVKVQLPYIFGVGLAWLCCTTIDKVSRGSAGGLYLALYLGCVILGWAVGVFGVVVGGLVPSIGLWTMACFLYVLYMAVRKAMG